MYIQRKIKAKILDQIKSEKKLLIVIYGPRQVGKTTLAKEILRELNQKSQYYSCDLTEIQQLLTSPKLSELTRFVGDNRIIVLDEAQRVSNIGLTLKILYENFPDCQFIATGSSSFDLSNSISEPLTGRKSEFLLLPFSWQELESSQDYLAMTNQLNQTLLYGNYPLTLNSNPLNLPKDLNLLTNDYLFKDILLFENLKNTDKIKNLLVALAYQIGKEVSINKLANMLDLSKDTIEKYIDIAQKSFIIFKLPALKKNLYNEIAKTKKYYFWDIGIRNSLIRNFGAVNLRDDIGGLWENFCVSERMKYNLYNDKEPNSYFWRTSNQSEIDYVEEYNGQYSAWEFKYTKKSIRQSEVFVNAYPTVDNTVKLVNRENFEGFLGGD